MLQPPLKVRIFQKYAIGKSSYRQNMSLLQKKYACFTFKACKITLQIEEIEFFTFSSDIYVSQLMLQSLFFLFSAFFCGIFLFGSDGACAPCAKSKWNSNRSTQVYCFTIDSLCKCVVSLSIIQYCKYHENTLMLKHLVITLLALNLSSLESLSKYLSQTLQIYKFHWIPCNHTFTSS